VERWIKSFVMLVVLIIWSVYMVANMVIYLFGRGPLPEPALWGVPGGIWLALNPPFPPLRKQPEAESKSELP